jgi:flagellar hook-basal body complex protein FliE
VTSVMWKVGNGILVASLGAGFGFGYLAGDKSVACGVAGIGLALVTFFMGALLASLKGWYDQQKMFESYSDSMKKAAADNAEQLKEAIEGQRRLCADAMVNIAKATVGRVVDRVLAEHPVFSVNREQLEAAKEDAKVVVGQELEALEDAVAHQFRSVD